MNFIPNIRTLYNYFRQTIFSLKLFLLDGLIWLIILPFKYSEVRLPLDTCVCFTSHLWIIRGKIRRPLFIQEWTIYQISRSTFFRYMGLFYYFFVEQKPHRASDSVQTKIKTRGNIQKQAFSLELFLFNIFTMLIICRNASFIHWRSSRLLPYPAAVNNFSMYRVMRPHRKSHEPFL